MNALEPECVLISPATFLMGCERGRDDEKPVHRVSIDAFEMAVVQVRNRDFAAFLETVNHPQPPQWNDPDFSHPEQPLTGISWIEAVKYCDWLGGLTGQRYRLPTEAEWEWAACGGHEGAAYPWGDEPPACWPPYLRRWGGEVRAPLQAGTGVPNNFGLYDISENVHEWCADWYDSGYYAVSPSCNPKGSAAGARRASRGGSWRHHVKVSRCAARSSIPPQFQYTDYGFRLVREPAPGSSMPDAATAR
ncbi:MAG: formylglycine-generating enzyme family protein [Terriglobia bacterium]